MPLIKKIEKNNYQIGIWEMSESLEHLYLLNNKFSKFRNINRKIEFLSTNLLLNELTPNSKIFYNKYGAPQLKNNNFISISHSKDLVSMIISNKRVGIDIEKISKKPLKLSSTEPQIAIFIVSPVQDTDPAQTKSPLISV